MSDISNTPKVRLQPNKADQRAAAEAAYQDEQAKRERAKQAALSHVEPLIEREVDLGRTVYEQSVAISLKRIADTLDEILAKSGVKQ